MYTSKARWGWINFDPTVNNKHMCTTPIRDNGYTTDLYIMALQLHMYMYVHVKEKTLDLVGTRTKFFQIEVDCSYH